VTSDLDRAQTPQRSFADILEARLSRRTALSGMGAAGALGVISLLPLEAEAASATVPSLAFTEIPHTIERDQTVAPGYSADVLIRWGDKVAKDAPRFDPARQTAEAQERQFGYNNDYLAFLPLPLGSGNSDHGLLVVNHEYTNTSLMFSGLNEDAKDKITREQADIEMAAHGLSVVEIRKTKGKWRVVENSTFARRLSMRSAEMVLAGPAAGHARLKTKADPSGTRVVGTLNNCGGGTTPWGTVLTAEENFDMYFGGDPAKSPEASNHKRIGLSGKSLFGWSRFHDRMNVEKEPNEPNRFGWIVEFDPYDPKSTPVKRTALGRFKHEAATTIVNANGRVSVYSGDDAQFEYLYRFVSRGRYNPADRKANMALLDDGILYVAKFHDDGRVTWLPLVHGEGLLTQSNGFASQADVLIDTRRAADLLGATPLDRPEDVEASPATGKVYMALTNNAQRKAEQVDKVNPRANNRHGHIIELTPPLVGGRRDHAALEYSWNVFLLAGDPAVPANGARYHAGVSRNGWLSCPDNVAFDRKGRLWIATDQGSAQAATGISDGMYATETEGPNRALTKFFYAAPKDAEMCGPCFTPDGKTLFVAVQHPGEAKGSTFDAPSTRFPDFDASVPPRPSVVAITKKDGGEIGS